MHDSQHWQLLMDDAASNCVMPAPHAQLLQLACPAACAVHCACVERAEQTRIRPAFVMLQLLSSASLHANMMRSK
jgi:hypothetical protein